MRLALLMVLLYRGAAQEVSNCGIPPTCLCTGNQWLVFCDGPAVQFLPQYITEPIHCTTLVIQNTRISTLYSLQLDKWHALTQLHVTGNSNLKCSKERSALHAKCNERNITLIMPCGDMTTSLPSTPTGYTDTPGSHTSTSILHTGTSEQPTTPHPSTPTTGIQSNATIIHQAEGDSYRQRITAILVTCVVGLSTILALIGILFCAHSCCKRRARVPNIIYNDTNSIYRMNETSFI